MKYVPFKLEEPRPLQIGFLERSVSKASLKFKEFYIANKQDVSWHSNDLTKLQFDDGTIVKVLVIPPRYESEAERIRFINSFRYDQIIIPFEGEEYDLFMYKNQAVINDIYSYILSESLVPPDYQIQHYEY